MYLYIATFPNNKKYIGITSNINKRKTAHKSRAKNNYKGFFYNAIRKYGWDNIKWEIADGYKDINELGEVEIKKIAEYKTQDRNFGYNISKGGDGSAGFKHTQKFKEELSKRTKGKPGKKWSEEQREYFSNLHSGKKHPQFGKHRSEETKAKIKQKGNASENRYNVKLSWKKVNIIRSKYNKDGSSIKSLADRFGVGWATISDVVKNRTWKK